MKVHRFSISIDLPGSHSWMEKVEQSFNPRATETFFNQGGNVLKCGAGLDWVRLGVWVGGFLVSLQPPAPPPRIQNRQRVPPLITRGGAASHSATCPPSTCSTDHLRRRLLIISDLIIWLDPDAPTAVGSKWRMARLAALWVVNRFGDDGSMVAFLQLSIQHWGSGTAAVKVSFEKSQLNPHMQYFQWQIPNDDFNSVGNCAGADSGADHWLGDGWCSGTLCWRRHYQSDLM